MCLQSLQINLEIEIHLINKLFIFRQTFLEIIYFEFLVFF